MIEGFHHRVPGGDEQDVERFPVLAEDLSVSFRDREDNVSVRDIDTHDFRLGRQLFLILYPARGTESRVTVSV